MVKRLKGSQYGEGIGSTVSIIEDPNDPSFDAATHKTSTDDKIRVLLEDRTIHLLSDWERQFLMDIYGKVPLSQKQHIKVARIYRKHVGGVVLG
jgi:hypothetical protein